MYLGIEIGGTKLQLGVGCGGDRKLVELKRCNVMANEGARGILQQIEEAAPALIVQHGISRIGVGFGGPVQGGRVTKSHQIAGWENFGFAEWARKRFQLPTVLGNDCDAAALAESAIGAGHGARTVYYVTVGTGVGGGLVIDGKLHGQGRPAVAEIGHLRPGVNARSSNETVESLASGPGIVNTAAALADQLDPSQREQVIDRCGPVGQWTEKHLACRAMDGEPVARSALSRAVEALGWAIAQVITIVAPDVVIVGGGVSLIGEDFFFVPLRQAVDMYVFPPLLGSFRIVPAALGEEAVVHGAIQLAIGSNHDRAAAEI